MGFQKFGWAAARVAIGFSAIAGACGYADADDTHGTYSFVLENDVFYNLDRDYTNGFQFAWTSPKIDGPCWECDAARLLPFFEGAGQMRVNYALGQSMFTPKDLTLVNPPLTDRPYAGWLYGSMGVVAKDTEVGGSQWSHLEQLQLSLGVVGPSAQTEEVQKFVHKLIGSTEPMGWDTQLRDEPAFLLTYERSWRYRVENLPFGLGMFATPHLGGAVGNVFTYANAGATLTLGWNLGDDYGPPRVQPSTPGSGYFEQVDGVGLYVFAGVDGRAVARNIFLDGNTWQDSRSVVGLPEFR